MGDPNCKMQMVCLLFYILFHVGEANLQEEKRIKVIIEKQESRNKQREYW